MSRNGKGRVDLKLNLSLSGMLRGNTSRRMEVDVNDHDEEKSSSPSSCVSSEATNSPEATSMVLAGCPRCLMYVMLAENDPRCPKCKNTVILDFLNNNGNSNNGNNNKGKSKKNKKS